MQRLEYAFAALESLHVDVSDLKSNAEQAEMANISIVITTKHTVRKTAIESNYLQTFIIIIVPQSRISRG